MPGPILSGSNSGPLSGIPGCFVWLKADAIGTPNNTPITYWQDLSNSGNNVTYPTAGSSVQYFPTLHNNIVNGYPALLFNGLSNYLTTNTNNQSLNGSTLNTSVWTVYNTFSNSGFQAICANDQNPALPTNFVVGVNNKPTGLFFYEASTLITASSASSLANQWWVRRDTPSGTTLTFALNGIAVGSGNLSSANVVNSVFQVGWSNHFTNSQPFFSGYIAEIVVYNQPLSVGQVAAVDNYLIQKYLVPPPPPFGSPASLTGLIAWYKASSIGLTQGNSPVGYWQDDSGSGNNCTYGPFQSGVWSFPTYQPNQINGWPTVRFSNVGLYNYLYTPIGKSNLAFAPSGMTTFSVFLTNDTATPQSVYSVSDGTTSNVFNIGINAVPADFYFDYGFNGTSVISASSTTFGTNMLAVDEFMIRHDRFRSRDGEFLFGRYGADVASGTSSVESINNPLLYIGYDRPEGTLFYGDIAEIILYNRQLLDNEVELVNNYLLQKYKPGNVGTAPLFTYGDTPSGIYADKTLYTVGRASGLTQSTTLYIGSSQLSFSGLPLYTSGVGFSSLSTTLFTPGSIQQYPPITLFVDGGGFPSGSIPLYISSSQRNSNFTTLYISGSPVSHVQSGSAPLYLLNIPTPSTNGQITLFVSNNMSSLGPGSGLYTSAPLYLEAGSWFASLPLFVNAGQLPGSPAVGEMPLYVYNPGATGTQQGTITLFIDNSVQVLSSHKKLYTLGSGALKGGLPLQGSMNLSVSGY